MRYKNRVRYVDFHLLIILPHNGKGRMVLTYDKFEERSMDDVVEIFFLNLVKQMVSILQ